MIDSGDKTRRKKTYNLTKRMRKTWENKIQSLWLWVEYMSTKEIKGRNGNLRSCKKMQGTWWEAEDALAKKWLSIYIDMSVHYDTMPPFSYSTILWKMFIGCPFHHTLALYD
jgi:hypothetical protein